MARSIDYGNLSVDDLHYIGQRNWLLEDADSLGFPEVRALVKERANITEDDLLEEEDDESNDESGSEGQKDADSDSDEDEEEEDDELEYDELDVAELKEELKKRDLPVSGNKAELVARLVSADAAS